MRRIFLTFRTNLAAWSWPTRLTTLIHGVRQLDIVKFVLPLAKISFHPIFAVVGKHTNFFEAFQAASQPFIKIRRSSLVLLW